MNAKPSTVKRSLSTTMTDKERIRADAIMKGWLAFNAYARSIEDAFNLKTAEIGRAVADLIAERIGVKENLIEDRDAEFGRIIGNTIRTYQMKLPYYHQGNDALIKEQLKWMEFAFATNQADKMIRHAVDSMREILGERVYWVEQTGDIRLALDAITTPTCWRDLVVADGFQWHDDGYRVSYVSPYKRILEKGWLRNIWTNLTERKIHEEWTVPLYHGFAEHLQARFIISPWNEATRLIEVSVEPL
ncbi:MAG: hypothetical protein FJ197_07345 [Gammaproteobacteria bacterium]|nr:hypothetical protein [Gammaproteobacteria bacterium]